MLFPKPNHKRRVPDWKPIKGYEGLYEVSNDGRVRNREKEMKLRIDKFGYNAISLCKNSKRSMHTVHRLVATHFIENVENKKCVNHKDGVKTNNSVENLEWSTYKENNAHARQTGLYRNERIVNQINRFNGKVIAVHPSIKEAEQRTGVKESNISSVVRGKTQTAGGYIWEYSDEEAKYQ